MMWKKTLEILKEKLGDSVISIYNYEKIKGANIPVFVVKKMNFTDMSDVKKKLSGEKFIILTESDIVDGKDIFALSFLHIKYNSVLVDWKSVFSDMSFDKKNIRHNLEMEIRYKLIELREAYLSFDGNKKFLQFILPVMEPIRLGAMFLYWWDLSKYQDNKDDEERFFELISFVDSVCSCNGDVFKNLGLTNTWEMASIIEAINKYLNKLCREIDQFPA